MIKSSKLKKNHPLNYFHYPYFL